MAELDLPVWAPRWPPHCAILPRAPPALTIAHKAFGGHQNYVLRGPGVRAQGPSCPTARVRLAGHSACCASGSSSVKHDDNGTHCRGLCEASGSKLVVFRLSLWDWAAGVGRVGRLTSPRQADTYPPVSGHVGSAWCRDIGNCPWSQGPELSPGSPQAWHGTPCAPWEQVWAAGDP